MSNKLPIKQKRALKLSHVLYLKMTQVCGVIANFTVNCSDHFKTGTWLSHDEKKELGRGLKDKDGNIL